MSLIFHYFNTIGIIATIIKDVWQNFPGGQLFTVPLSFYLYCINKYLWP